MTCDQGNSPPGKPIVFQDWRKNAHSVVRKAAMGHKIRLDACQKAFWDHR